MSNAIVICLVLSSCFVGGGAFRKKTDNSAALSANQRQKHSQTLSDLQALAHRVVSGEEKITDASRLALDGIGHEMVAIIDDTAKQHAENQEEVDSARDAISFCGTETTEKHTNASGINDQKKSVDAGRTSHNSCRKIERSTLDDKADKCNAFQTYRDGLSPPSCACPLPDGDDTMLKCISKLKEWSDEHDRHFREKKKLCDDATLLHDQTQTRCHTDQTSFEGGFCTYAASLTEACESQTRCREKFIDARDKTHSRVKVAENGRKAEYTSAKMIQCLLSVLNATAAEMPGLLARCEKIVVDTSSLNVDYPAIPVAAVCDPSPAASKPCDNLWLHNEYETQKDWYSFTRGSEKVQPKSCIPCEAKIEDLDVPVVGR